MRRFSTSDLKAAADAVIVAIVGCDEMPAVSRTASAILGQAENQTQERNTFSNLVAFG
jgi:hypothetical protein